MQRNLGYPYLRMEVDFRKLVEVEIALSGGDERSCLGTCGFEFVDRCSEESSNKLFVFRTDITDREPAYCVPCTNHLQEFIEAMHPAGTYHLLGGWEEVKFSKNLTQEEKKDGLERKNK